MGSSRWNVRVAIGDPQAPFTTFLAVLERHGLLAGDRLRDDVFLASMGDHFDYGSVSARAEAGRSGMQLLAWLASYPAEQVVILAGNHDLARVGELASFDDASFAAAQQEADAAYAKDGAEGEAAETSFLAKYPQVPTAECVARDFSNFRVEQRELVHALLASGRMRAAYAAADDLLLSHAGVTVDATPAPGADAVAIAASLQDRLATAFAAWAKDDAAAGRPLVIPSLPHLPGDAERGEGDGIFYHRPCNPKDARIPSRRYDPRQLPLGLTQVIGHIGDEKCRKLLAGWTDGAPHRHGVLRHLVTDGTSVRYQHGTPQDTASDRATMLFVDGAMAKADLGTYELLDLDTRSALVRR